MTQVWLLELYNAQANHHCSQLPRQPNLMHSATARPEPSINWCTVATGSHRATCPRHFDSTGPQNRTLALLMLQPQMSPLTHVKLHTFPVAHNLSMCTPQQLHTSPPASVMPLTFLVARWAKKMCTSALWVSRAAAAAKASPSCRHNKFDGKSPAGWQPLLQHSIATLENRQRAKE